MVGEFTQPFPASWQVCRLDEVATVIDSLHKTPTYTETGRPMVRVTDVRGGFLDVSKTLRVTEDVFQEFTRRYAPKRGDIVFSRVGSYGNASFANTDIPFCLGQNTALLSPRINGRFLHLFLQSTHARWQIEQVAVGSTQKTISLKSISALTIPIPPAEELEAIAHILGTLDDKIELNRRMNQTLEAMARALFKSWFVDFDPVRAKHTLSKVEGAEGRPLASSGQAFPGLPKPLADPFPDSFEDSERGEIPKGWEVKKLGDLLKLAYGKALKAEDRRDGNVPVYGSNGQVGWHDQRLVTGPGIVVGRKGNPGIATWVPTDFFPIDTTFYVVPKSNCRSLEFLFHVLRTHDLASLGADSAVPGLNRNLAYMSDQLLPPARLLEQFECLTSGLSRRVNCGNEETRALAAVRNSLLPKLISGEVRVNAAELISVAVM